MKFKYLLSPLVFIAMGMFATASYAVKVSIRAPATAVKGVPVAIYITVDPYCNYSIDYGNGGTPISFKNTVGRTFGGDIYRRPIYSSSGLKFITVRVARGFLFGWQNYHHQED